jgi:hypothetical protein
MTIAHPLTHAERYALGVRARKQLARSAHSRLDASACPPHPLELLFAVERTRLQRLIPIKHERMAANPFGFFRGAVPIMAADLAAHPNTGITTQLCGDAHVLNLGAYETPIGTLAFDINDFDETIRGPFEWDVKRLATSLILAGREAGIRRPARQAAVKSFLAQYRASMADFAAMPVIELARHQIHRLPDIPAVETILRTAQRSTPQKSLAKLTEPAKPQPKKRGAPGPELRIRERGGDNPQSSPRRFRNEPPILEPLGSKESRLVLDALGPYARTLQPERRHFLAQYRPVGVAFKVVGTGSVGLRDFCIYFEGLSRAEGSDPLFLQMKEEPASAYAAYLTNGDTHSHQGHRAMDGQRAMQLTSDPFLGYTTLEGRDFLVRQLNDHKASLNLPALTPDDLEGYAGLCGELFARGHARAGDPVSISAYLGKGSRFDKAILAFAHAYADKTEHDYELFKRWLAKAK